MSDPLGLIGNINGFHRPAQIAPLRGGEPSLQGAANGPGFKDLLQEQINKVNQLQCDANVAMEDLAAGRRDDVESVIIATQKADTAFRLLLQVRNKVMDAYEEVKQLRI